MTTNKQLDFAERSEPAPEQGEAPGLSLPKKVAHHAIKTVAVATLVIWFFWPFQDEYFLLVTGVGIAVLLLCAYLWSAFDLGGHTGYWPAKPIESSTVPTHPDVTTDDRQPTTENRKPEARY